MAPPCADKIKAYNKWKTAIKEKKFKATKPSLLVLFGSFSASHTQNTRPWEVIGVGLCGCAKNKQWNTLTKLEPTHINKECETCNLTTAMYPIGGYVAPMAQALLCSQQNIHVSGCRHSLKRWEGPDPLFSLGAIKSVPQSSQPGGPKMTEHNIERELMA